MVYKLIVKPEADVEIITAVGCYLNKDQNLGFRFSNELKNTLQYIELFPEHCQKKYQNIRIGYMNTFPYGIHYIIEDNTIFVFWQFCIQAVIQESRSPRNKRTRK